MSMSATPPATAQLSTWHILGALSCQNQNRLSSSRLPVSNHPKRGASHQLGREGRQQEFPQL